MAQPEISPLPPTLYPFESERRSLLQAVADDALEAIDLARWMSAHPELALEEQQTSARYRSYLQQRSFGVREALADMPTAFRAQWGNADAACRVALLAEMDALPEIGHACGHNLSGPASLLAAAALARVMPADVLQVVVIGSPAEEIGEGKRRLVEAGCFEGLDLAMMAHASDMRRSHRLFLGNRKYEFVYHGVAAHAAAYPEKGVNALDAAVTLYVSLGLLRQQLGPHVRIHAVFSDGGRAPNVIPERAALRVWVRALDMAELADAADRVRACADAAAVGSGSRLELIELPGCSPTMRPNAALADCYRRQLDYLGLEESEHAADQSIGSSDITHVSQVLPTIHPNFPIGQSLELHTRAFARAAASAQGEAGLLEAARALALTAQEVARSAELRDCIRRACA